MAKFASVRVVIQTNLFSSLWSLSNTLCQWGPQHRSSMVVKSNLKHTAMDGSVEQSMTLVCKVILQAEASHQCRSVESLVFKENCHNFHQWTTIQWHYWKVVIKICFSWSSLKLGYNMTCKGSSPVLEHITKTQWL